MRRLGLGLTLLSALFLVTSCEKKIDVAAKTEGVRNALASATMRADFIKVAEANGLDCSLSTETYANCIWHHKSEPAIAVSPCTTFLSMITATGNFIDGRRQGDYDVELNLSGC